MNIKRLKFPSWRIKYSLIGVLVVLVFSTWMFGRTVAAPCGPTSQEASNFKIKIIPTSEAIAQSSDKNVRLANQPITQITNLSLAPAHDGLGSSTEPQLRKLAESEKTSGGALASGMMIFTNLPADNNEAQSNATEMSGCLKDFAKYGIKPIVVMEPTTSNGTVSFSDYKNGSYDTVLNTYFSAIKNLGINDSTMGMWVYFPEANLPEWGPVDIADFAPNVTRTVNIQKKIFPASLSSIMLDAESYPAGSTDWGTGSYASLLPFIKGIPTGLIDSFGLQGFPWAPPANQTGDTSYDPAVYLNNSLATEAANHLGTKNVWLNTGTFAAMYTNNKSQTVIMPAVQRQAILNDVLSQVTSLKNNGFSVAVNLFNEDKSNTSEAIDWSYKTTESQIVLKNFALQLQAANVEVWIFDS